LERDLYANKSRQLRLHPRGMSDFVIAKSSLGNQTSSLFKSAPKFGFGTTGRNAVAKVSLTHEEVLKQANLFQSTAMVRGEPCD